jgi:hypothetical protein
MAVRLYQLTILFLLKDLDILLMILIFSDQILKILVLFD